MGMGRRAGARAARPGKGAPPGGGPRPGGGGGRAGARSADRGSVPQLVEAARRGEAWALTEIWQRHAPAVTGYLRGRGASEPEDLTSDVFLAVFERLRSFRGDEADLRAFVFTV